MEERGTDEWVGTKGWGGTGGGGGAGGGAEGGEQGTLVGKKRFTATPSLASFLFSANREETLLPIAGNIEYKINYC